MAKAFSGLGATICDATADLPSSPIEGLIVFQKDTNELKIYDGASWISMLDTDVPPALNKIATGTLSGTSFNITNVFSSAFNNYKLLLSNISFNAYGDIYSRMLVGATPYAGGGHYWSYRGILSTGANLDNAAGGQTLNYMGLTNTVASVTGNGSYDIFSPFLTSVTSITGIGTGLTSGTGYSMRTGSANVDTNTSYDGIQLLTNSATTLGGTYTVYGYRI